MMGMKVIKKHINTTKTFIPLLILFFVFLSMGSASAAVNDTIYVDGLHGNDSNNGSSWEWAKYSIKNATEAVNNRGTVIIADGTYSGKNNINITINKNMTIKGASKNGVIINGENNAQIFNIASGVNITLHDLRFINGNATFGGAIYNNGALNVNRCTFTDNTATSDGGTIYNNKGTLTIVNSTFTNNTAGNGGVIYNGGLLVVNSSVFISNIATNNVNGTGGGAIYNDNEGAIKIANSKFIKNIATGNAGGAIFNENGTKVTINNSQFIQNGSHNGGGSIRNNDKKTTIIINNCNFTSGHAEYGGAICNSGILIIINCNFTQNIATNAGGAISNANGTATIVNSTFTDNIGKQKGGALYNYIKGLTVTGSTFENNNAPNGGTLHNSAGNVTIAFNRIINNGPNEIYNANGFGSVEAKYNWWGSNSNPSSKVNADVNVSPWLVLTITPNPDTIKTSETSILTIDLQHDSNGIYHNYKEGHVPDGIIITFTRTQGTLNPTRITLINGSATATFTTNNDGTAVITATVDSQNIATQITVNKLSKSNNSSNHNNKNTVKAADTIAMQKTGLPLNYLIITVLMVLSGLIIPKRR